MQSCDCVISYCIHELSGASCNGVQSHICWREINRGARLRGCTATQRSEKGSEKVLDMVLGKGSQKGSEKGVCYGFYSIKGF